MKKTCCQCGAEMYIKPSRANQKTFLCSRTCDKEWNSIEKRLERGHEVNQETGCWEWVGALTFGYGVVIIDNKTHRAHRISYEIHKGPIPKGLFVCHSCDNPKCINPEHLWVGTNSDNMKDCSEKGRLVIPESFKSGRAANTRLTENEVLSIRQLIKDGRAISSISKLTGTPESTIRSIRSGRTYKQIQLC